MLTPPRQGLSQRIILIAALTLFVAAGVLVARGTFSTAQAPPATTSARRQAAVVQAAPATRGAIRSAATYAGTVQASQQVNVVSRTSGIIRQIPVEVGAFVRQGDTLAVLDPGTLPEQLAKAHAAVAAAQAKLDALLAGAKPDEVAIAQAKLDAAQARLDAMLAGSRQDVPTAQASLEGALARLEQLEAGPKPESLAAAQASLHSAQTKLQQLRAGGAPLDVQAAQASLESARAKLDEVLAGPTGVQLGKAQADVQAADQSVTAAQIRWREARSDSERASASASITSAAGNLTAAQAKLKELQQGPTQAEIEAAEAAVAQAQARLSALQPTQAELAAAEAAVFQAQKTLADLQPTQADLAAARAQVAKAQDDLAQSEREVFIQEQLVKQEEANLSLKQNPYLPPDIAAAQAAVLQARAEAAVAQANLDQMVVTAPFDGVVGQRLLSVGAFTSTQAPIMTLVSPRVEVHIAVEEARVGRIRPGLEVQLVTPAYPNTPIAATVVALAPVGDARSHTFDATIVADSDDGKLLPGMFVQAQVVVAQDDAAVLVPKEAVLQREGGPVVFVLQEGLAVARSVEVGISDEGRWQIASGVSEGDQVVTVGQSNLTDGQPAQVLGQQQRGGRGGSGQPGSGGRGGGAAPGGSGS